MLEVLQLKKQNEKQQLKFQNGKKIIKKILTFSQNSIVKLQYTQKRKQKLISNLDKGTW